MSAPRRDRIGGVPPLALALAAQLVAAAPVFGAGLALAAATGATVPLPGLLALQGAAAALLGMRFGLAWWWAPIQLLLPAAVAAGRIHSDIERGFIRGEVVAYDDLLECGSQAEARTRGLLRSEGREYLMQDGDTVNFLFSV